MRPKHDELQPGDEILEVDHVAVKNAGDLSQKVKAAPKDKPVLLLIRRGDVTHYVAVQR